MRRLILLFIGIAFIFLLSFLVSGCAGGDKLVEQISEDQELGSLNLNLKINGVSYLTTSPAQPLPPNFNWVRIIVGLMSPVEMSAETRQAVISGIMPGNDIPVLVDVFDWSGNRTYEGKTTVDIAPGANVSVDITLKSVFEGWEKVFSTEEWTPLTDIASAAVEIFPVTDPETGKLVNKFIATGGVDVKYNVSKGDMFYSYGGAKWYTDTFSTLNIFRFDHTMVYSEEVDAISTIFVLGGTTDGSTPIMTVECYQGAEWFTAPTSLPYPGVFNHASVLFNGKIYIYGGKTLEDDPVAQNTVVTDEVWYNGDIFNSDWTISLARLPMSMEGMGAIVYQDKVWLMGGRDGNGNYLDTMYYSTDGENFTLSSITLPIAVADFALVLHNNKIWLLGGALPNDYYSKKVYVFDGSSWSEYQYSLPMEVCKLDAKAMVMFDGVERIITFGGVNPDEISVPVMILHE